MTYPITVNQKMQILYPMRSAKPVRYQRKAELEAVLIPDRLRTKRKAAKQILKKARLILKIYLIGQKRIRI